MIRHKYEDVLTALRSVEPASTSAVFDQLESFTSSGTSSRKRRRAWLWGALMTMARAGKVEYVVERRRRSDDRERKVYVWRTK